MSKPSTIAQLLKEILFSLCLISAMLASVAVAFITIISNDLEVDRLLTKHDYWDIMLVLITIAVTGYCGAWKLQHTVKDDLDETSS